MLWYCHRLWILSGKSWRIFWWREKQQFQLWRVWQKSCRSVLVTLVWQENLLSHADSISALAREQVFIFNFAKKKKKNLPLLIDRRHKLRWYQISDMMDQRCGWEMKIYQTLDWYYQTWFVQETEHEECYGSLIRPFRWPCWELILFGWFLEGFGI